MAKTLWLRLMSSGQAIDTMLSVAFMTPELHGVVISPHKTPAAGGRTLCYTCYTGLMRCIIDALLSANGCLKFTPASLLMFRISYGLLIE